MATQAHISWIMLFLLYLLGFLQWGYYVTMPMPASTFTIAVGKWQEAKSLPHNQEEGKSEKTCAKLDQ